MFSVETGKPTKAPTVDPTVMELVFDFDANSRWVENRWSIENRWTGDVVYVRDPPEDTSFYDGSEYMSRRVDLNKGYCYTFVLYDYEDDLVKIHFLQFFIYYHIQEKECKIFPPFFFPTP